MKDLISSNTSLSTAQHIQATLVSAGGNQTNCGGIWFGCI